MFRRRGGLDRWRWRQTSAKVKRSVLAADFRIQKLALDANIGARLELKINGSTDRFVSRRGYRAYNGFRDQVAKGLVEPGKLSWFQTEALVKSYAAKRARVGGAQSHFGPGTPYQCGLGAYAVSGG